MMHCKNLKRKLNKKIQMISLVLLLVILAFSTSGCINSSAKPYRNEQNEIVLRPYSEDSDYYATIFFVDYGSKKNEQIEELLINSLKKYFSTKVVDGYPSQVVDYKTGEVLSTTYAYDIKIEPQDWFFVKDQSPVVKYGFFIVSVSANYTNPFSLMLENDTKFNDLYKSLVYSETGSLNYIFINTFSSNFNTKVLLPASFMASTNTGEIVYNTEEKRNYVQFSCKLMDTQNHRLEYSYKVMASYTWFSFAILMGIIAVLFVLLFAKDKQGKMVNIKDQYQDPFDHGSSNGKIQIFEGF